MMRRLECWAALLAVAAVSAWADAGDPPSRVARLNYLSGPVSFRPGSVEEWTAATLNYPLTTGDHLWTDTAAQGEMHVGSSAIRLDSQTALSILNLDDRIVQLSLTQGTIDVHIRFLGENESFEVDSPNIAISILRPGDYRFQADGENNITVATVRGGEAEATGGGTAFPLRAGQSARIAGMDTVTQDMGPAPPPDGFDRWCQTRDQREASVVSARYVPREMIGYEDLDQYGVWRNVPPYGWVWSPRQVVVGWTPYHYGHWAWVEPWGWTWIDDAPWGFAPFHYGRWAFVGGAWIWAPGSMAVGVVAVRPVYAPALVAFVGGAHFGVGLAVGGGVGVAAWFPLGPGEVYRPAYHVSTTYVQQVNITHVTNVTTITNVNVTNVRYVNQTVPGAVTAVPQQAFVSARSVHEAAVTVPPGAAAQAQVMGSTAQIAPQRQSVMGGAQGGSVAAPPARFADRAVVARNTPPPPPVSFAAKQQALQSNGGRPLDPATEHSLRATAPPVRTTSVRTVGASGAPAPTGNAPAIGNAPARVGPTGAAPNAITRNDRPPGAQGSGPLGGGAQGSGAAGNSTGSTTPRPMERTTESQTGHTATTTAPADKKAPAKTAKKTSREEKKDH